MMGTPYFNVRGKLTAQPGKGPKLLAQLLEAARGMEDLPDCYCYIVGTQAEEPDAVHVFEVWTDAKAHQASLQMPVFQELIRKARPLIAGMADEPPLLIHGGKAKALP